MSEEQEQTYMTVGELAEKVGVTVRTIQYYDQENLLKPSAKGNRNQRLYTHKDEETLYKILCFKFMGLSLTEIRQSLAGFEATGEIKLLLEKKINDVEKEMSALMKRFATLKNLSETVKSDEIVNWQHYAHVIERFQDEGKYLWKLNCSFEENAYREQETEQRELAQLHTQKQKAVEQWHKLIADTIRLLHQNEPVSSSKSHDIARRYLAMESEVGAVNRKTNYHDFVIFDSAEKSSVYDSFHELRFEVNEFLQNAVKNYQETQGDKNHDRILDDNQPM